MLIHFHNVHDGRDQAHQSDVTLLEAELVRGDLELNFVGSEAEAYALSDVSIPLAIAEIRLFLARLQRHGKATWRLNFAPFLDGKFENGSVRLMEGSRDHLSGKTVALLSPEVLEHLEANLDALERRFGRLRPTESAVDFPSLGGG